MTDPIRIAIAASGSGTCFQSVLDNIREGRLDAEVVQLITDKPDCKAVERAREYNIPVLAVEVPKIGIKHSDDTPLSKKERRLAARVIHEDRIIRGYDDMPGILETAPQEIVMLGYMRVLSDYIVGACRNERIGIWNTHPGPIPEYRGENGYGWGVGNDKQSVQPNRWHCVSFHNVSDAAFDTGNVLSCSPLEIIAGETEESLKERGMQREYEQIRQCLQWLAEGRVIVDEGELDVLDGNGLGYCDAMQLRDFFRVTDHERYVIEVETSANDGQKAVSAPISVKVIVSYAENGNFGRRVGLKHENWSAEGIPYNLAFTYARQTVESLRADGIDVDFTFDGIDLHPVVMKSDLEKRNVQEEQGGIYHG